jgi:hypothetical protein
MIPQRPPNANGPVGHDPELHGLDINGLHRVVCPGCLAEARAPSLLLTPAQARRRQRGQRLAALVEEHADALKPILTRMLAPAVAELVARCQQPPSTNGEVRHGG